MNLPDCRAIAFEQGILAEPMPDGNRLVVWVPGNRDASFQYWERIGNVARAEISAEGSLCATAATAVPGRQRLRGGLGQLFKGLRRSSKERDFSLPDGSSSEQCGERRTDLLLVWSVDSEGSLDEARIQSVWPGVNQLPQAEPEPLSGFRSDNPNEKRRRASGAGTGTGYRKPQGTSRGPRRGGAPRWRPRGGSHGARRPGSDPDQ